MVDLRANPFFLNDEQITWVEDTIRSMTPEEKIGQLFVYLSIIDFPIFNLADIFVSWSAVLLILFMIFKYKDEDYKELLGK